VDRLLEGSSSRQKGTDDRGSLKAPARGPRRPNVTAGPAQRGPAARVAARAAPGRCVLDAGRTGRARRRGPARPRRARKRLDVDPGLARALTHGSTATRGRMHPIESLAAASPPQRSGDLVVDLFCRQRHRAVEGPAAGRPRRGVDARPLGVAIARVRHDAVGADGTAERTRARGTPRSRRKSGEAGRAAPPDPSCPGLGARRLARPRPRALRIIGLRQLVLADAPTTTGARAAPLSVFAPRKFMNPARGARAQTASRSASRSGVRAVAHCSPRARRLARGLAGARARAPRGHAGAAGATRGTRARSTTWARARRPRALVAALRRDLRLRRKLPRRCASRG